MIIYDGLKSDFMASVENDTIAPEIEKRQSADKNRGCADGRFNFGAC